MALLSNGHHLYICTAGFETAKRLQQKSSFYCLYINWLFLLKIPKINFKKIILVLVLGSFSPNHFRFYLVLVLTFTLVLDFSLVSVLVLVNQS